jgi:hypothetical protein
MERRKKNRSLELIWRGSTAYGTETDMFMSQYPTGETELLQHSWQLAALQPD